MFVAFASILTYCKGNKEESSPEKNLSDEVVARGKYLVTIGSCNLCHSPKIPTFNGLAVDSSSLLSGHPGNSKLSVFNAKLDSSTTKASNWTLASLDMTSFAGPWGISYTANLTPDTTTGIGAWTEEVFIKTLKTGRHLGQENGRQILPPMPWIYVNQMTDDDLKAVYAYLRSLPPIQNQVPGPVPPEEAMKKLTQP
jgi:mono/diheme cytochrome c family protein